MDDEHEKKHRKIRNDRVLRDLKGSTPDGSSENPYVSEDDEKELKRAKWKRYFFRAVAVTLLGILAWKHYSIGLLEAPQELKGSMRFLLGMAGGLVLANTIEHWKDG